MLRYSTGSCTARCLSLNLFEKYARMHWIKLGCPLQEFTDRFVCGMSSWKSFPAKEKKLLLMLHYWYCTFAVHKVNNELLVSTTLASSNYQSIILETRVSYIFMSFSQILLDCPFFCSLVSLSIRAWFPTHYLYIVYSFANS